MDKEFLYSQFNKKLVDDAYESIKSLFYKEKFKLDYEFAKNKASYDQMLSNYEKMLSKEVVGQLCQNENLPESTGKNIVDILYDQMLNQMTYVFLEGASHAVSNNLTEVSPSEENFSDYRKDYNFAVLFNYVDNDFAHSMECGAELFCEEFNNIFGLIDMYANNNSESSLGYYIDKLNTLTKIENIKEVMKCGFFSEEIRLGGKYICSIPEFESTQKDAKKSLEYIQWDGETNKWEKIGDDYVITEKLPRFIVGTNEEIAEAIKKYGTPHENPDPDDDFPVWCNGEVIVLYMKNGYLTYKTR